MDSQANAVAPTSKSPLASKQIAVGAITVLASMIGRQYPEVGDWMRDNAIDILGVLGGVMTLLRPLSTKSLDFKDWTLFGVGKKF